MPEQKEEAKMRIAGLEKENQELEREAEPLYTAIGKNYYERPEGYEKEMKKAVGRLDAIRKQMHENRVAILACKGIRLCPNCGGEVEQGAIFCGECGIRIEAVKEVDENSMLCSRCGAKNEKGKKFCVICGQKLVDIVKAAQEGFAQNPAWPEAEGKLAEKAAEPVPAVEAKPVEKASEPVTFAETEPVEKAPEPVAFMEAKPVEKASEPVTFAETEPVEKVPEPVQALNPAEGAEMPQEDVIFCPECGNKLPADALFCGECGTRIVAEMPEETRPEAAAPAVEMPLFCTECGAKLSPGSVFCAECGTPVLAGR